MTPELSTLYLTLQIGPILLLALAASSYLLTIAYVGTYRVLPIYSIAPEATTPEQASTCVERDIVRSITAPTREAAIVAFVPSDAAVYRRAHHMAAALGCWYRTD